MLLERRRTSHAKCFNAFCSVPRRPLSWEGGDPHGRNVPELGAGVGIPGRSLNSERFDAASRQHEVESIFQVVVSYVCVCSKPPDVPTEVRL